MVLMPVGRISSSLVIPIMKTVTVISVVYFAKLTRKHAPLSNHRAQTKLVMPLYPAAPHAQPDLPLTP